MHAGASTAAAAFLSGLGLGLGLIVAIGAQNAFVLRQGLRREHVAAVVVFCLLADAALIAGGVAGMAAVLGRHAWLARALALAGGLFLVVYGVRALLRARDAQGLAAAGDGGAPGLRGTLARAAAFTLLNPHVYLDTLLLVGNVGARQPGALRAVFALGAICASLLWFSLLGFGARWLAPWFARPRAWQLLELLTGGTLLVLGLRLLPQAFG